MNTAEYNRAYYLANKARMAERVRAYYLANKDKIVEYQRAYGQANRDRLAERGREWRELNKDKKALLDSAYGKANRDKGNASNSAWKKAHPERHANSEQVRRARKAGNGVFEVSAKEALRIRNSPCVHCGAPGPSDMDHVISIARGGRHSIGNLQALCKGCNSRKSAKFYIEFKHNK